MKKSVAALLLAVCMTGLTACGGVVSGQVAGKVLEGLLTKDSGKDEEEKADNDGKAKDGKDQEEQNRGENIGQGEEETGEAADGADSKGTEEADVVPDKAEKNRGLELKLEKRYLNEQNGTELLMQVEYPFLSVNQENFPGLFSALESLNGECEAQAVQWKQQNLPYAQEVMNEEYFYGYEYFQTMHVHRADAQTVSIISEYYEYTGGAHGGTYFTSKTFDSATGRELTLADVTADLQGLADAVIKELNEEYPGGDGKEHYRDTVEKQIVKKGPDAYDASWALSYHGIIFDFGSYELGAYAMGCPEVFVPFDQYPGLIKEEYTRVPEEYAVSLKNYTTVYEDTDGDGSPEEISVSAYDAQDGYRQTIHIYIDETSTEYNSRGWFDEAYLIHQKDGSLYLYVYVSAENDEGIIHIFRLSGESAVFVEDAHGYLGGSMMENPGCFRVYDGLDALSTYSGYRDCRVGDGGRLEALDDVYTIEMYTYGDEPERHLTAKIPVPAWMISEDGSVAETPEQLPAGTRLYFRRTDNRTFVEMELEDGRRCQIRGEFATWPKTINGISEYDCFDGIMYAG